MADPRDRVRQMMEAAKLKAAGRPAELSKEPGPQPLRPGALGSTLPEDITGAKSKTVVEPEATVAKPVVEVPVEEAADGPSLKGPGLAPKEELVGLVTPVEVEVVAEVTQPGDELLPPAEVLEPKAVDRSRAFEDLDIDFLTPDSDVGLSAPLFEVPEPGSEEVPGDLLVLGDRPVGPRDTVERPAFAPPREVDAEVLCEEPLSREGPDTDRQIPVIPDQAPHSVHEDGPDTEREIPQVQTPEPVAKPPVDFEAMVAAAVEKALPGIKDALRAEVVGEVTEEVGRQIKREVRAIVDPFMDRLRATVDGIYDLIEGPQPPEGQEKTDHGIQGRIAQLERDLDRALGPYAESADGVRQFTKQIVSNLLVGALSVDKGNILTNADKDAVTEIARQYGRETVKEILHSFTRDSNSVMAVIARDANLSLTQIQQPEFEQVRNEIAQVAHIVVSKANAAITHLESTGGM